MNYSGSLNKDFIFIRGYDLKRLFNNKWFVLVLYNVVYLMKCFFNVKYKVFIVDIVFFLLVGIQMQCGIIVVVFYVDGCQIINVVVFLIVIYVE